MNDNPSPRRQLNKNIHTRIWDGERDELIQFMKNECNYLGKKFRQDRLFYFFHLETGLILAAAADREGGEPREPNKALVRLAEAIGIVSRETVRIPTDKPKLRLVK